MNGKKVAAVVSLTLAFGALTIATCVSAKTAFADTNASASFTQTDVQALADSAVQITGYSGAPVKVTLKPDGASYAGPAKNEVHIAPGWFNASSNYDENLALAAENVGHEVCHLTVGISHLHDLVFRACELNMASEVGVALHFCAPNSQYWYEAVGAGWGYTLGACSAQMWTNPS